MIKNQHASNTEDLYKMSYNWQQVIYRTDAFHFAKNSRKVHFCSVRLEYQQEYQSADWLG